MTTATEYKRLRVKHPEAPANTVMAWVRHGEKQPEHEFTSGDILDGYAEFERGRFTIHVSAKYDECPDYSHLGEFSDTWQEGAIQNPDFRHQRGGVYRWFIPANTEESQYKEMIHEYGKTHARELAQKYVRDDYKRAVNYMAFVVVVTVFLKGVELGSDVLGGIDIGDDFEYLVESVYEHDMVGNALEEAEKTLSELCPTKSIHIEGRRWFQRLYGNTYHSVRIWIDGELVLYSGETYGYGDQYLQTAFEWLFVNGYANQEEREKLGSFTLYLRETLGGTYSVVDVERKRDL